MPRQRTLEERLVGAAVFRVSFELRGEAGTTSFKALYRGILEDLALAEEDVTRFLADHRADIESRVRAGIRK